MVILRFAVSIALLAIVAKAIVGVFYATRRPVDDPHPDQMSERWRTARILERRFRA